MNIEANMAIERWYSIIKLKGCLIILILMTLSFILILAIMPEARSCRNRLRVINNLKQLYIMMMIYTQDWNEYPKVTPEGGNGVRDLYALYETGILDDESLSLLQPPGCNLSKFSRNPTIDEFDKEHIGFSYNSTAIPDDPDNPPLLADQGVWSGRLQKGSTDLGIKSREEEGALVLFGNGKVEFIKAYKDGTLPNGKVSSNEWRLLKDDPSTNGYIFSTIPESERHKNLKRLCALVFIIFITFIAILYTAKIWRTRVPVSQG
jgi:hypothetical protein